MDGRTYTSLRKRLRLCPQPSGAGDTMRVHGPVSSARIEGDQATFSNILKHLQHWSDPAHVFEQALRSGGPTAAGVAASVLNTARAVGALQEALFDDLQMQVSIQTIPGSGLGLEWPDPAQEPPLVWAEGVTLRPQSGGWNISSPLGPSEGWISNTALPDVPTTGWCPAPADQELADLLSAAGLLVANNALKTAPALASYALEMHSYSRRGTCRVPVGALDRAGAAPAKPAGHIPLPEANTIPRLCFADLRTQRRSLRPGRQPSLPLTAQAIATLLWTAARNLGPPSIGADGAPRIARPYPGAGGCHSLDLYLVLASPIDGLPCLSRYDPTTHRLAQINHPSDELIAGAGHAMGSAAPEGLIVLGGRFDQLTARYGDASYPLLLKEAGIALQTLHLTCAAIGVQSCILGGGDSRAFARATRLEPAEEGPFGEIARTGLATSFPLENSL